MPTVTKDSTFTNGPGNVIDATQVNANFDELYAIINGLLDHENFAASAKPVTLLGQYEGSFDDWPAHVGMVLEASEAEMDSVLGCFWSSAPGLSSADGLDLIGTRERSYLCFWSDWGEGHRALACLQPGFDSGVTDDLLEQAGRHFRGALF